MKYLIKKLAGVIGNIIYYSIFQRTCGFTSQLYSFVNTEIQRNDEDIVLQERLKNQLYLERYGYKVYSQNDEDGIIEEIFNRINTTNKVFVEFGVGNGLESNCHFLLHKG
jgi:hypothetical protein